MSIATRSFTLVRREAGRVEYQFFGAMRVRVDVENAVDFDPNIFLYRQDLQTPYAPDDNVNNTFLSICSPADIADYPIGGPDPEKAFPFFRISYVELDFRSTYMADTFWQTLVAEAGVLLHAFNKLEELQETEVAQIGPFPEDARLPGSSVSFSG